ncbi:MAG: sigma-70 family RNA polymerase sigma factor [Clostridiales bacterium]|nr:sigma-70 family RNA polymerase sigma factor [Clostridiales bacterium]
MKYQYETATGTVEIEVSKEWAAKLKALDREENANNKMETRRHLSLNTTDGSWLACEDEQMEKLFQTEKSKKERLHDAIDQLKPAQKEIILMVYFKGKTQEEIAEILGITQGAVSQRLTTAEKNLKKLFEKT